LTQSHNHFAFVYCFVDNTLSEVSAEIHCLNVSSRDCCYKTQAYGSKPI